MRLFPSPAKKSAKSEVPLPTFRLSREILGIFLITLAVLVFLSLWSFALQDVGWFALQDRDTVGEQGGLHNLVGLVGAYIAASLIWVVGSVSLAIPFLILLHGIRIFQEERETVRSLLGSVLLILCVCTLIRLHHPFSVQVLQDGITMGLYAGKAGIWMAGGLEPLFGQWGSTILLGSLLLISLLFITPFSLSAGVGRIPKGVGKMGKLIRRPVLHWPAWLGTSWRSRANKQVKINRSLGGRRGAFSFMKKEAPLQEPPARERDSAPADIDFLEESPRSRPNVVRTEAVRPEVVRPDVVRKVAKGYHLPDPLALLEPPPVSNSQQADQILESQSHILTNTLQNFGIAGKVTEVHPGPVITMYEFVPGARHQSRSNRDARARFSHGAESHECANRGPASGKILGWD